MKYIKVTKVLLGFFLAGLFLFLESCSKDDDPSVNTNDLIGKWSILKESATQSGSSGTQDETHAMNEKTVEFKSDGSALFIDVRKADWGSGTYTTAGDVVKLVLGSEPTDLKVVSMSSTDAVFTTSFTEDDNGTEVTIELTITVKKNDGTEPTLTESEWESKLSVSKFDLTSIVDVDGDGEYDGPDDETISRQTITGIPVNRFTLENLSTNKQRNIDNVIENDYNATDSWRFLDESNIEVNDGSGDLALMHLTAMNSGKTSGSIFYIGERSESFGSTEYDVRTTVDVDFSINDGTEPSMAEADLVGTWTISDFTEYKNGNDNTNPNDSPLGSTLVFNSDGTGTFTMETPVSITWKVVDANTLYFTGNLDGEGEDEEILLTYYGYNAGTGVLGAVQGWVDEDTGVDVYVADIELTKD